MGEEGGSDMTGHIIAGWGIVDAMGIAVGWSPRKPTIMRFCVLTALPAAVDVTSRTGGFIGSATLFGTVTVRLPRFRCAGCGHSETGISWPSHCRSTPELDQLRAHLSALMPYRVAAGVLAHLLPVEAGMSPETLRGHTLKIGEQLRDAAAAKPAARRVGDHRHCGLDLHPQLPRRRTASGGSRRQRRDARRRPAGIRRCREGRYRHRGADPAEALRRSAEPPTPS